MHESTYMTELQSMSPSLIGMLGKSTPQRGRRIEAVKLRDIRVRLCDQAGYMSTDHAHISGLLGAPMLSSMSVSPCRNV